MRTGMIKKYIGVSLILLLLLGLAAIIMWLRPSSAVSPAAQVSAPTVTPAPAVPQTAISMPTIGFSPEIIQAADALLKSPLFVGTTAPQGLQVDHNGQLIINKVLQQLFDYYLLGDSSPQHDIARYLTQQAVKMQLHQLPAERLAQVVTQVDTIYQHYIALLLHIHQMGRPANAETYATQVHQARIDYLTASIAQVFYPDNEQRDIGIVKRHHGRGVATTRAIQQQPAISAEHAKTIEQGQLRQKESLQAFQTEWQQAGRPAFGQSDGKAEAILAKMPESIQGYIQALVQSGQLDQVIQTLP